MNNKLAAIVIVLLFLLIGGMAALGYLLFKERGFQTSEGAGSPQGENASQNSKTSLGLADIETVKISDPITTNLAVSDNSAKTHMIQFSFSVGVNKTVKKESSLTIALLREKEDIIKHAAIDLVSRRTKEQIETPESKNNFAQELLERLRTEFCTELIVDIYVYEWKVV
jgi:flagellar basal body-associated protein FliL